MAFFIWKRAGFIGLYTSLLPIFGAPWVVENYMADRYPDYTSATEAKLMFYGLALVLTSALCLFGTSLFKRDSSKSLKDRVMEDHIYYLPLAAWPPLILIMGILSIQNHWKY